MKKLNKLTAVLLSLTLCLGMVAPAFAASFDDLQDAINGVVAEPDAPAADVPQNGTQVKDEAEGTFGYGWNGNESSEGKGWDIWAKDTADGGRDVELHGNVTQGEGGKDDASTIIVDSDDGKVNIGLNDHNITGNGKDTVIEVQQGGDLTITGGEGETGNTISNNPSNAETPAEGANGIDVEGKLELDGVTIKDTDTAVNVEEGGTAEIENSTITDTDTAVNVEEGGTAQIEDSTITGNNTGVAFVDDSSVTFVEDQNVVNGNTTNISGTGKVKFELDGTTHKVDAETAETLLADKDKIADHGTDWILTENDGDAYTVVYTGHGGPSSWQTILTPKIVSDVLEAAGAGGKEISGFVVSGDVTEIGGSAFKNCTGLTEVQLKGTIESIGTEAFYGCSGLKTIDLPESVTTIGTSAFSGCTELTKIVLPKGLTTLKNAAFQNCSKLAGVVEIPAGVTSIGGGAFNGCTSLEGIKFAENSKCTEIGNQAFYQCTGLNGSVVIPGCVTRIGSQAFGGCTGLEDVQLTQGIETIDDYAFSGCSGLKTINIPKGVTKIGRYTFDGCKELTKIELPDTLTTLDYCAFQNCAKLAGTVTIPAGVTTIMQYTFKGCTSLEGIKFAENSKCTEIKNQAFEECKGLKDSVVIPESVTSIGDQAFKNCASLEDVQIKGNVETIGVGTFSGCSSLKTVGIPKTVTTIGREAFNGCKELTAIELPEGLTVLGNTAFKNCINLTGVVTIPAGVGKIDVATFYGCENLSSVVFAEGSNCTSIEYNAFWNCSNMTSITIPDSVTTIGAHAFSTCKGLETVQIKGNVTSIGGMAFAWCTNLKSINIPDTVTAIEKGTFRGCSNLKTITVPASVKGLGQDVFIGSGVKSIFVRPTAGNDGTGTANLLAANVNTNIFIKADDENLTFYRGKVSANFGHNEGENVKLEDGSVALTNVSGTITVGESAVTIPTGAPVSIDTNGNITVNAPITVGGVSCPYGATIAPDGTVTALPAPPVYDDYTDPTEVEVDDPAVPLAAGPVTRAQFVDYLWRHEGSPEGADCTFADVPADHEYVLALGWAEANGIAAADADGNFQPDELVTVEAVRAILGSFTNVFGTNAVAVADLTTLTGDDGEAVLNCDQVLAEFFGEEYILPEDLDILEPDDAA